MATRGQDAVKGRHWALAVLCVLRERPMHPYEMRRLMRERHKEERLLLKPGSLYRATSWLEQNRFVEAMKTDRQGKRPERTVYRITPAGEVQLIAWLRELLSTPLREPSSFAVALDHAVHLSPEDAATALESRAERLRNRMLEFQSVLEVLKPRIGRINVLELEYEAALCRGELAWVEEVARELRSGGFTWNIDQILGWLRGVAAQQPGKPLQNRAG